MTQPTALTGKLRTWNDDRGYGFISPTNGGRELFVHISAFPRDGSRPTPGETLMYEVGTGKDGKPQAVKVYRQALGRPADYPQIQRGTASRRSRVPAMVGALLVIAMATYAYRAYHARSAPAPTQSESEAVPSGAPDKLNPGFRCDGRTHCSQMTSCSEAKFFLANCPGTKMDGNNDGEPCEQQWCTGPLAE